MRVCFLHALYALDMLVGASLVSMGWRVSGSGADRTVGMWFVPRERLATMRVVPHLPINGFGALGSPNGCFWYNLREMGLRWIDRLAFKWLSLLNLLV